MVIVSGGQCNAGGNGFNDDHGTNGDDDHRQQEAEEAIGENSELKGSRVSHRRRCLAAEEESVLWGLSHKVSTQRSIDRAIGQIRLSWLSVIV